MSLSRFLGLGEIFNKFDPTGLSSVSSVDTGDKTSRIVVDFASIQNKEGAISRLTNLTPSPVIVSNKSSTGHPLLIPDVIPLVISKESGPSSAETLFNDFNFKAVPVYNFWVDDEMTNDKQAIGDRKLIDVPRYIKLTWDPSPELSGSNLKIRGVKYKNNQKYSRQNALKIIEKGIDFTPDHLQKENFDLVNNATANGYLSPATIKSVLEIPEENVNDLINKVIDKTDLIDEDVFLDHPDFGGVDIKELRLNAQQSLDPLLYSAILGLEDELVYPPTNQGNLRIGGDDDFGLTTKTNERIDQSDQVDQLVDKIIDSDAQQQFVNSDFVRAKFIDTALVGLVKTDRSSFFTRPEHAEVSIAISTMLPHLVALANYGLNYVDEDVKDFISKIPSFPAPAGLKPLEYVGYEIEKSQMNDGVFEVVEIIRVPDQETFEFYDSKVLYGETYRYRIRSILRWTREDTSSLMITKAFSQTKNIAPFISSYFHGEWSAPWMYATVLDTLPPPPPDELIVRTESHRKRAVITIKLPEDSQRDIQYMRIYRKLKDRSGDDLTGWVILADNLPPINTNVFDDDVDFFEDVGIMYAYTAQTISRHQEMSDLSEQYGAKLNRDWDIFGEHPIEFISNAGVKLTHFGAFSVKPYRKRYYEIIIPVNSNGNEPNVNFSFAGRERTGARPSDDRNYVVRVESLDTGEILEENLNLQIEKIREQIKEVKSPKSISFKKPIFNTVVPFIGKLF